MTEDVHLPSEPKGGLSPDFDLAADMEAAQASIGEFEMPIAVEKANQLLEANNTDAKTGLLNQQAWLESFKRQVESLGPNDTATVYVSDLNGFKAVNDREGHDAGDELLDIVGQAYKNTFKRTSDVVAHGSREEKNDSIARLGGDEFAVFVVKRAGDNSQRTATNAEELEKQPGRVNDELKKLLAGGKFEKFGISLSIGAAEYQPGDTAEAMFAQADLKMFEVKYRDKIEGLDPEDLEQLRSVVAFLEKIGHRVEDWAKNALNPLKPAA